MVFVYPIFSIIVKNKPRNFQILDFFISKKVFQFLVPIVYLNQPYFLITYFTCLPDKP